jgi:hypothetical protein
MIRRPGSGSSTVRCDDEDRVADLIADSFDHLEVILPGA